MGILDNDNIIDRDVDVNQINLEFSSIPTPSIHKINNWLYNK